MSQNIHGWLILDKPIGISSANALNKVKRILNVKKLGHSGTLDPLASGVLVIALGEATKAIDLVMSSEKSYEFIISWGQTRDTGDAEGIVMASSDIKPSYEEIKKVLPYFTPVYLQAPPKFSAVKIAGKRAYDLARAGLNFETKPKQVEIFRLDIVKHYDDKTKFKIDCGKGFYIRSFAVDIATQLGCLGYVSYLRRTKSAKFDQNCAISLESLEELVYNSLSRNWNDIIFPITAVLDDILVRQVSESESKKLKFGQKVLYNGLTHSSSVIAVFENTPVAICVFENQILIPKRIFNL